jgi:molecular chaperone GrpE
MENFRKRQQRLAEERVQANQGRLLRSFLMVSDDLERALGMEGGANDSLREGVELTYRSLKQLLKQEGVEQIEADGEIFDPTWHEAVATVPHEKVGVDQDIIVEVAQQGYHLNGRLLRPARVVVAT